MADPTVVTIVIAGLMVLAILFILAMFAKLYRKVGPHEALIVYGFRGTRVVQGSGTVVFPMVENCRGLSLELMSFDVAPKQDLYTRQGVAVTVEAVAQIKVKSDRESILTAAEQFLTKPSEEREGLIRLVMEGHLRGIIGQLTVEEIVKQPEMVGERMRSTCADDMNKMGLEVISFTIKEVRDKNEYITNMGRPDIARIKRDADVASAEADRDTAIKRALAAREAAVAKAQADQERVLAETLSQAKQAEAQRDLEVKKAEYLQAVKAQQAQADKAYEIQANVMQQKVRAEEVTIHQIEREHEVKVQEAEIQRRDRELTATVLKQAEFERKRIETLAEAEKLRLVTEAEGRAAAIRAQGEAEAEIIFKKGEAEAKAMNTKAEAYQEFNQAAIVDKLITSLPDVVKALASPLANVDKITIVSTGNGDAAGMNKITGDITKMAAQVPALFETLSGMPLGELLGKVRLIGDKTPKPAGDKGNSRERHSESSDRDAMGRDQIRAADDRR
ncbi:MAG TPA: SPFH domain-containing protein [Xanthobacteraceae bacterium]|nr:SPFH domain-containing protein [Xanthobacteraceae bacterium]